MPVRRLLPPVLLALLCAAPAWSWSPETRVHMIDEAIRLMPRSLRLALERHREPLLRGMLEPQIEEDGPRHRPPWAGGTLDGELEARARAIIDSVEQTAGFREIAHNFGALAHFVMDAGFPPGATRDGDARYGHFAAFCDERRVKFPLVFYGHHEPHLEVGDYRAFADAIMSDARAEDETLARIYATFPTDGPGFDDRSVPFAVGSLSYSRTITNIVRAWIHAWRDSYGDLGRTPYLEPAPTAAQQP